MKHLYTNKGIMVYKKKEESKRLEIEISNVAFNFNSEFKKKLDLCFTVTNMVYLGLPLI